MTSHSEIKLVKHVTLHSSVQQEVPYTDKAAFQGIYQQSLELSSRFLLTFKELQKILLVFGFHTEFFPEAINHSSINLGNGIEEIQAKTDNHSNHNKKDGRAENLKSITESAGKN